jgi:hypothetical protein
MCLIAPVAQKSGWYAGHDGVLVNIGGHDSTGSDNCMCANRYSRQDTRVHPDICPKADAYRFDYQ